MFSLRSSLFRFLLAGESESLGEVAGTHGSRAKRRTGERGWGGKEKPYIIQNARSSTNGRQLDIMIGQSRVYQNDQCQQLVNALVEVLSVFLVFLSRARRKTLNGFGNNRVNHCQGKTKSSKDGTQSNQFELTKTIQSFSGTREENKEDSSVVRVILPFKDQTSANAVKRQMCDHSHKIGTTLQPVFTSRKPQSLIDNAWFTLLNVICAIQIMSALQLDTSTNALSNINILRLENIFRQPMGIQASSKKANSAF